MAPPCVDVTLIYSLWFRSSSPPARRPPLANTLPARLHIFGRKLLAGVESNFQSVSPSLRRNPARQEEGRREDGIVWSPSSSSSAAAVIFAHTMAALARGGQRRRTSEEKKGIRFRIPKFFPNRAEPGKERRTKRARGAKRLIWRKKCIEIEHSRVCCKRSA